MVFRPEKLQIALINFACESLGVGNISGHNLTVRQVAERETSPDTPALFIVSAGYDPSKELE
jgi:dynein heavy chain 2